MAEWYCSALAGGGGDGSVGSPWTLAEGATAWGDGTVGTSDTLWLKADGIYTTAGTTFAVDGATPAKKRLSGYTSTIEDGGKATVQRSGGIAELLNFTGRYYTVENLILDGQDAGTENLKTYRDIIVRNVESYGAGTMGIYATYANVINCYAHDNGTYGILNYTYGKVVNSIAVNNGGIGIYTDHGIFSCISKGNTGNNLYVHYQAPIINCISDEGSGHGIVMTGIGMALNCIMINSPAGKYGFSGGAKAINCDFYGNDADIDDAWKKLNCQALDPQFNDPGNLDYTRTGTNLDDKGFSEIGMVAAVDYNIDIGPDQKVTPDYPAEADVEDGVDFDYGNKTGIFEAPAEDDVRDGVGYGAAGAEYDGDLVVPAEADVKSGVGYGADGVEYEGELVISRVESPVELSVADDRVILEVADG